MRHSRICLGATAPPSLFLQELPRGQWGHSQPLISGVLRGFWQQLGCTGGEFVVETKLGAGQCLASPLLDVCWGWRENASPNAAAQRPQSDTGRAGWDGSTPSDIRELGLSPCLLSQAPVPVSLHMPCSWCTPGTTAGGKKALSVRPREPKDVNAPLEPGDVSLFAKKTPGMGQGDLQCGLRLGEGQRLQRGPRRAGRC